MMPMINGHRSPVFGTPVPVGSAGMSPGVHPPPHGMPIPMGASPRQPAGVPGTPPYRNTPPTPLSRQSPGLLT